MKLSKRPIQNKEPLQVLFNLLDYIEGYLGTIKMKLKEELKAKPLDYYIKNYHEHKRVK